MNIQDSMGVSNMSCVERRAPDKFMCSDPKGQRTSAGDTNSPWREGGRETIVPVRCADTHLCLPGSPANRDARLTSFFKGLVAVNGVHQLPGGY